QQNLSNFYQLDNMAEELVDLCYDFSLSCAINYGKEKLPVELDRLKNVVGQAKNVIMSIRENNIIQAKSYLNQLNIAIVASAEDEKFNDLRRVAKFSLDELALKEKHDQILESANQIAYWGEQYVQSNYEEEEVQSLLQSAILAFNVFEGKAGCSGAYNELISFSKSEFLYFTEEPMFFKVKTASQQEVAQNKVKTEVLGLEKKETVLKKDSISVQNPQKVKPFDPNDLTTLEGALPNNLIIMMDVSASMKLTGKLPLLKSSIIHLLGIMRPEDRISLIAYSGKADLLIGGAGVANKAEVRTVLDTLHSSGGTDIENGLLLAYATAKQHFMPKGNNRVIIVTDGEFGVKANILKLVQEQALKGFALSVFQFNEAKDYSKNSSLELLAETGKGRYEIISSSDEALEILMKEVKKR
ncbi:MAG: VWA domain-containing protein, partial [Bacteroidetes bacterium]|nr:VWA domain-containing protein [Bacteroidota bacterium]